VTDFGIAHALDVDGMTITGTIMGSSSYIAPEQARGEPVDEQSDIYSLGCVLYELLTGEVPFDGDNFVAVAMRHVNDPVPTVGEARPDVPPHLDWAIRCAMAKDNDDRFASMSEFAAELEACYAELDGAEGATVVVPPRRPARAPRARRTRGRRSRVLPFVLLGVGLAALIGGLAGALLLHDNGSGSSGGTPPRPSGPVHFTTAAAYDPFGDRQEHDQDVNKAIDSNPDTAWETEHYQSFTKPGVGLVVGTDSAVSPKTLTIETDTPGFTAQIKAGGSSDGPFDPVSGSKTVNGSPVSFDLTGGGRYFLVWITSLGGNVQVAIDEITAR
jgi:eukaryotic-like serine/threonine-protein kinase